jgi:hypothetical protein
LNKSSSRVPAPFEVLAYQVFSLGVKQQLPHTGCIKPGVAFTFLLPKTGQDFWNILLSP